MFSLIITLISIALVAALALATTPLAGGGGAVSLSLSVFPTAWGSPAPASTMSGSYSSGFAMAQTDQGWSLLVVRNTGTDPVALGFSGVDNGSAFVVGADFMLLEWGYSLEDLAYEVEDTGEPACYDATVLAPGQACVLETWAKPGAADLGPLSIAGTSFTLVNRISPPFNLALSMAPTYLGMDPFPWPIPQTFCTATGLGPSYMGCSLSVDTGVFIVFQNNDSREVPLEFKGWESNGSYIFGATEMASQWGYSASDANLRVAETGVPACAYTTRLASGEGCAVELVLSDKAAKRPFVWPAGQTNYSTFPFATFNMGTLPSNVTWDGVELPRNKGVIYLTYTPQWYPLFSSKGWTFRYPAYVLQDGNLMEAAYGYPVFPDAQPLPGAYYTSQLKFVTSDVAELFGEGELQFILKTNGDLMAVGTNNYGRLGTGSVDPGAIPTLVLSEVQSVATDGSDTYVLKTDGTLWAAGYSRSANATDPFVQVRAGLPGGKLSLGPALYLVQPDGTLWVQGYYEGSSYASLTAVDSGIKQVSSSGNATAMLRQDGTVWSSGSNNFGALGRAEGFGVYLDFVQVFTGAKFVSTSGYVTFVVDNNGQLWGAGTNVNNGMLGDGGTGIQNAFIPLLSDVASVVAGQANSLAFKTDGSVWRSGQGGLTHYKQYGNTKWVRAYE